MSEWLRASGLAAQLEALVDAQPAEVRSAVRSARETHSADATDETLLLHALAVLGWSLLEVDRRTLAAPAGRTPPGYDRILRLQDGRAAVLAPEDVRRDASSETSAGGGGTSTAARYYVAVHEYPLEGLRRGGSAPVARLASFVLGQRPLLRSLVVYAVTLGVLSLSVPLAVQVVFDALAFGGLLQPLVVVCVVLAGTLVASAVLRLFEQVIIESWIRRTVLSVVVDLTHRLPRARLEHHTPAEAARRFFEIVSIDKSVGPILYEGTGAFLQVAVGVGFLALYHPYLIGFAVALLLLGAGALALSGWGAVGSALRESSEKYALAGWLHEVAEHAPLFAAGGSLRWAVERADERAHAWLDARTEHFGVVLRQQAVAYLLQAVATVGLLLLGGWLVLDEQLSLGQLVAAELVTTVVVSAMAKVSTLLPKVYDLAASLDKLGKVVDEPTFLPVLSPAYRGAPAVDSQSGESLIVRAGRWIAVSSDDDASTEGAELLRRLRDARGASVDGIVLAPAEDAAPERPHAVLVEGASVLDASLLDNVRVAAPGASDATLVALLEEFGLTAAAASLEGGLDEPLGPDGERLTTDERALLSLARAVAARPSWLLLDGVLDSMADVRRQRALAALARRDALGVVCRSANPRVLSHFPGRFPQLEAGVRQLRAPRSA